MTTPQSTDGWIPWSGGECPIAKSEKVTVRLRSGRETQRGQYAWTLRWNRLELDGDIVAYRVIE